MPGVIIVDDEFTGLANNASILGRVPPITTTSQAWNVDANSVLGGGNGDVKFIGVGKPAKLKVPSWNGAIQAIVNTNGGNEEFFLFTRDTQTTPYPRYGYMTSFNPSSLGGVNGVFSVTLSVDFVRSYLAGYENIPWTFSSNNINVFAFESIGSNHRVIINNVVAASFTDSTYIDATNDVRWGFVSGAGTSNPSIMRLDRFSFLDSVVITESSSYTIVRVS